jgi:hypothetical protein
MTRGELLGLCKAIATVLKEQFAPRDAEMQSLTQIVQSYGLRIMELEARPVQKAFREVWRADLKYEKGESVSHAGSTWHARSDSIGRRPGDASSASAWVLSVKCGRDGRDGKDLR